MEQRIHVAGLTVEYSEEREREYLKERRREKKRRREGVYMSTASQKSIPTVIGTLVLNTEGIGTVLQLRRTLLFHLRTRPTIDCQWEKMPRRPLGSGTNLCWAVAPRRRRGSG
jgi:hypothetical protein